MTERMAIVASQLIPLRTHLFSNANCAILVDFRTLKNFGPAALVKSHTEKVKISVVEDSLSPYSPTVSCLLSDPKLPCLPVMGRWLWLYKLSRHLPWNTAVNRGATQAPFRRHCLPARTTYPGSKLWFLCWPVSRWAQLTLNRCLVPYRGAAVPSSKQLTTWQICRKEPS